MGKIINIIRKRTSSFIAYPAIALLLLSGCAVPSANQTGSDVPAAPVTEKLNVSSSTPDTAVEVASSSPAPYTATPEEAAAAKAGQTGDTQKSGTQEQRDVTISEPRVMLEPEKGPQLNHVLGIDFTILEQGRSRLTIMTDKKTPYDLDRRGEKGLILKLSEAVIPPVLLKGIDASPFESSLDMVRPEYTPGKKDALIHIDLKEMVPFHVKQTDKELSIDFGRTSIKTADKKIMPLNLAGAQTMELAAKQQPPAGGAATVAKPMARTIPAGGKGFSGEPMYLDFVNADVTHILRLINEVSDDNIIWDPEIAGQKVSMILKDVPWDEALELILKNNALAKRYVGDNIIWVTTKAKMKQIEAEEEAEARKAQEKIENEMKKQEEQEKKEVEQQPLVTEYLPVDFATVDEIKTHIEPLLSERGKMTSDTRTNTIIIKDIASVVEDVKNIIKQFDTPGKQVLIEARIVDASDDLTRDLGIVWGSSTSMYRSDSPIAGATVPSNAITNLSTGGDQIYGTSFSTNAPSLGWLGNIGLNFATLTSTGLGAITLDAQLALSEVEGKSKTISAPKVIARVGTQAEIRSGQELIIQPTENVAATTLKADLSLAVTPINVSPNDFITLQVTITDDSLPSQTLKMNKMVTTNLLIKSGDTVVIGGIIKKSETDGVSGIPLLKDIPGLGWLFKAKNKVTRDSELLVFVTPKVLPVSH